MAVGVPGSESSGAGVTVGVPLPGLAAPGGTFGLPGLGGQSLCQTFFASRLVLASELQRAVTHRVCHLAASIHQPDRTAGIVQLQARLPLVQDQDGARPQHRPAREAIGGASTPSGLQPPAAEVDRLFCCVEQFDPLVGGVGSAVTIPVHRLGRGQHLVDHHRGASRRGRRCAGSECWARSPGDAVGVTRGPTRFLRAGRCRGRGLRWRPRRCGGHRAG